MAPGESHFFLGQRYRLTLVLTHGRCGVVLHNRKVMEIHARPQGGTGHRERVLLHWYRERLRELALPLVAGALSTSSFTSWCTFSCAITMTSFKR